MMTKSFLVRVCGAVVNILASQAGDSGSNPGRRMSDGRSWNEVISPAGAYSFLHNSSKKYYKTARILNSMHCLEIIIAKNNQAVEDYETKHPFEKLLNAEDKAMLSLFGIDYKRSGYRESPIFE